MTENEALEKHKEDCKKCWDKACEHNIQCLQKKDIEVYEELLAYRAIGTVEGYERVINESIDKHNLMIVYKDRLKEYEAIGTIDEFKALKEKNEPKKPTPIDYEKYIGIVENAKFLRGACWCPNCKHTVRSGTYCDACGQKLDWGE